MEECKLDPLEIYENCETSSLMTSIEKGRLNIIKYLIEDYKIDPSYANNNGDTLLSLSA